MCLELKRDWIRMPAKTGVVRLPKVWWRAYCQKLASNIKNKCHPINLQKFPKRWEKIRKFLISSYARQ